MNVVGLEDETIVSTYCSVHLLIPHSLAAVLITFSSGYRKETSNFTLANYRLTCQERRQVSHIYMM